MKKVNLKGKVGLKKEAISKFEMSKVKGGETGVTCNLFYDCASVRKCVLK